MLLTSLSPPNLGIYVFMASHFCTSLQKYSFERMDQLRQFQNLIQATSREIMWINDCEEEELLYDWSDRNTDIARKQESFSVRQLSLPMLSMGPLGTVREEQPLLERLITGCFLTLLKFLGFF